MLATITMLVDRGTAKMILLKSGHTASDIKEELDRIYEEKYYAKIKVLFNFRRIRPGADLDEAGILLAGSGDEVAQSWTQATRGIEEMTASGKQEETPRMA